jgi:hypothetical protein
VSDFAIGPCVVSAAELDHFEHRPVRRVLGKKRAANHFAAVLVSYVYAEHYIILRGFALAHYGVGSLLMIGIYVLHISLSMENVHTT